MSFLRRLRRDKEEPTPPEESKDEPKEDANDDADVRVYGDDELRPAARPPQPVSPPEEEPEAPIHEPAPTPPPPESRPPPILSGPSPVEEAPPPAPVPPTPAAPAVPSGLPPPLPERGPIHARGEGSTSGVDSLCFVCGTPLEGKYCSLCRVTWVE